jgi:hypothetical protein
MKTARAAVVTTAMTMIDAQWVVVEADVACIADASAVFASIR